MEPLNYTTENKETTYYEEHPKTPHYTIKMVAEDGYVGWLVEYNDHTPNDVHITYFREIKVKKH